MSTPVQRLEALLERVRHNRNQPRVSATAEDELEEEVISLVPEPISLVPEPESVPPEPISLEPEPFSMPPAPEPSMPAREPVRPPSVAPPISAPPPAAPAGRASTAFEAAVADQLGGAPASADPAQPVVTAPEPTAGARPVAQAMSPAPIEAASFGDLLRRSLSLEPR